VGANGRGLSRKHILASIDTSLGRLGLDYVDLYQIHRWDSLTPIEETMDVLHDVVKAGKARYLGASGAGDDPPVPRPGGWHRALEPAGARAAGGHRHPSGEQRTTRARTDPFLHSLYRPDLDLPVIERAAEIAARRGVSTAQVALSWLLHKPGVTAPIAGATRLEHLEDALAAEQLSLSDEEIARLEEPYVPHPVSGIEL